MSSRSLPLNSRTYQSGPIIYWMSRDQRLSDNWAWIQTVHTAQKRDVSCGIVFIIQTNFLGATWRQFDFMVRGLQELERECIELQIPLYILTGEPTRVLPDFVSKNKIGEIFCDFSPLKIGRKWRTDLANKLTIPITMVDAHNIVPAWIASPKMEVGARTLRPKIFRLLPEYLTDFPRLPTAILSTDLPKNKPVSWSHLCAKISVEKSITSVDWVKPGEKAAQDSMQLFVTNRLKKYALLRNDPVAKQQSFLSPYLHFGHISAQRIALSVQKAPASQQDRNAYLEELIIRRELSDNFCWYQPNYDSVQGFPNWAQMTLRKHESDPREYNYTLQQLENGHTHNQLWNATQHQLVFEGTIPGYLRMFWAKKILEWSKNATIAQKHAIYLNDRYQLDGRDPNGYTGIAWAIGGVHDRAWFERPIFGLIRYMNDAGAARKFKVQEYIDAVESKRK